MFLRKSPNSQKQLLPRLRSCSSHFSEVACCPVASILPLFSRPTPNFILVHPSTICSSTHVKIQALTKIRSCHEVRSSRTSVSRFALGLDDLTLWHEELPDKREMRLFSHVSLKTSSSSFWPPVLGLELLVRCLTPRVVQWIHVW